MPPIMDLPVVVCCCCFYTVHAATAVTAACVALRLLTWYAVVTPVVNINSTAVDADT